MIRTRRLFFFLLVLALALSFEGLAAGTAFGQGPATGTPPFGSFSGGPEIINNANLNVHWTFPVRHKPGRGLSFSYDITYDSSVWAPIGVSGSQVWEPAGSLWGWSSQGNNGQNHIGVYAGHSQCNDPSNPGPQLYDTYTFGTYVDEFGVPHNVGLRVDDRDIMTSCTPDGNYSASKALTDGSGLTVTVYADPSADIVKSDGMIVNPSLPQSNLPSSVTDRNGNYISANTSGQFFDTLSSTTPVLTVTGTGTPTSPKTFTYTAPSGASATYTIHYTAQNVKTYFHCSGVSEYTANAVNLVSDITLPDNSKYIFAYEPTPQNTGYVTGRLIKVTLPTGGYISYAYSGGGTLVNGITCSDGSAATVTRTVNDGTTSNAWIYARSLVSGSQWETKVTTPPDPGNPGSVGNDTVIDFQKDSNATNPTNNFYETQRVAYQGSSSGTALQTVTTCYNTNTTSCTTTAVSSPITQQNFTTTIPTTGSGTLKSQHIAKYNSVGVSTEMDDYAFGSGAVGGLLRQTLITYAPLVNITAFQQTVTTKNGAGTILAQTNYNYDQTTPVAAPPSTAQLTSAPGSRGNLTSIQRCTSLTSCGTYLQTTMTYDTAGQLQTVKDPLNNQASFSYADNFLDDDGSNPPSHTHTSSAPTDAFATTITPPLNGAMTSKYYYYSGQLALSTDQNNNTSYSHFQDLFARKTSAYGPVSPNGNRPWTLNVFAASHTQADNYLGITDTTASASCTYCRHDEVALDGLGRAIHVYLVNDPEGQTTVDTAYDSLGRVLSGSHPHRSSASNTDGTETPTYDALGRTTKVTHQDATHSQKLYGAAVSGTGVNPTQLCSSSTYGLGFPVLAIDEAGKRREFWTDGLGRTIEADEPDSTGALNSNTCYSYDPHGNLLKIVRSSPSQSRTYAYDTLSRVTSVTIPELANSSGTNCAITYSYDSNSNLQTRIAPAPNQSSCTTTVTTTYYHDALNRLTKITYGATTPVATPTVQYGYDGTALTGCTTTPPALTDSNPKGRQTSMCDGSGATSWAHDAAGRIITEKRIIIGTTNVTQTLSYFYNLDGSIATVTYPSSRVVTYTTSNAQRLTAAKDVANNIQFATAASYVPPGGLSGVITGQISGGFGGITESHNYNNSLEYTSTQATSTAGNALNLAVNYNLTGSDNGTVIGITNNLDTGRTQNFSHDPLNRISSATTQATSGVDCWGQNFAPDALANLNTISSAQCSSNSLSVTVDANNHINSSTTFAYDAAGNMTQDGKTTGYSYFFDAENRLVQATGMTGGPYCYFYDGNGLRVAKKSGANSACTTGTFTRLYWRSISGDALAETDGSGNLTNSSYNEYVFFSGRRIASRNGTGTIFYWFADQLGSTRTITTGSGTGQTPGQLCYDADFTPYGQEISYTGRLQTTACPPNYKFTGYERDPETAYGQGDTGLDYAFARYYSSRLARFLSTDPLGGSIGDLQSHNAYAYVLNNPLDWTDPSGLDPCPNDQSWGSYLCKLAYAFAGTSHFNTWNEFSLLFPTGCSESGCVTTIDPNAFNLLGLLGGGAPYTGGGSLYHLVLTADCEDSSGRWRDYQAALPNNASGPVPPLTIAENLIGTDTEPTTNWGNNVGDHLRHNAILPGTDNFQQSFYAKTSGGAWRPMAVSINGATFTALAISASNSGEQGLSTLLNGQRAPMQVKTGNCPNNPGDQL
jgi:RHS repeat-associated protein